MAYQNVSTPRFIIDWLQWYQVTGEFGGANHYVYNGIATGYGTDQGAGEERAAVLNVIGLNPASQTEFIYNEETQPNGNMQIIIRTPNSFPVENVNVVGVLGHNLGSASITNINILYRPSDLNGYPHINLTDDFVINAELSTYLFNPSLDGFTLISADGSTSDSLDPINLQFQIQGTTTNNLHKIGSLLVGRYYDMPHSAELSLNLSHEYDGIKKQETAGGSTLSYANYYKPPDWGDLQAWQLDGWDRKYSGRRVWDLTFNHLSDSDLEPKHYNMDSTHPDWKLNSDGDNIGNWFTNVIHYTNGGQLPFIFCPDPSITYSTATNTIPEFAICRFDMKTFKRSQVANGVYNIKVKIKESW